MNKKIIIAASMIIAAVVVIAAIIICVNMQQTAENEPSVHILESITTDEDSKAANESSAEGSSNEGEKSKIELPIIPME